MVHFRVKFNNFVRIKNLKMPLGERGIVNETSNHRLVSLENAIQNASSTSWSWLNAELYIAWSNALVLVDTKALVRTPALLVLVFLEQNC